MFENLTGFSQITGKITQLIRSRISRALVFTWSTVAGICISTRGSPTITVLILAPVGTFLISLGVYLFNDLFDSDVDRINAPGRPIASRSVTKEEAFLFIILLYVAGTAIGLELGWMTTVITLLEILLGVFYSTRPFNFKDRFVIKTLSIGAGGVLANIYGGAASGIIDNGLIFCSVMFLVFLFATSPINDLADYTGDRVQNRRTIPIVIGPTRTVELSIVASVTPLITAAVFYQVLGLNLVSLIMLSVLAARSVQLLVPMMMTSPNARIVRKRHKQMVLLHFVLQGALALGALPL